MLLSHLSNEEIDIIISYLKDLDVFFWWFCGDRRMNGLIERTKSIRLDFPPQDLKWPSSFISTFKTLRSLSVSSIPGVLTPKVDWKSIPRGIKSITLDFRDCLDDFERAGTLADLFPSLEVFNVNGCSPYGNAILGALPSTLHTLCIEFRELLYHGRRTHEDDRHADANTVCKLLVDTPLPPSLTKLHIIGSHIPILPDIMTWPPHLQELHLVIGRCCKISSLGVLPHSLTVLHVEFDPLISSNTPGAPKTVWDIIPKSVTDLKLSDYPSYPSPQDLSPALRKLDIRMRLDPIQPVPDEDFWTRMPALSLGIMKNNNRPYLRLLTNDSDLTKLPRDMSSIIFDEAVTLDVMKEVFATLPNLRVVKFLSPIPTEKEDPTFQLPDFITRLLRVVKFLSPIPTEKEDPTFQLPDSITRLNLADHQEEVYKLPKSLIRLNVGSGSLSHLYSVPGCTDNIKSDKGLFIPHTLTTFKAHSMKALSHVPCGFRIFPATLRTLKLAYQEQYLGPENPSHLHCRDLPKSLTSLEVECLSMPKWCAEIPSSPSLSASLRTLIVNTLRVDRNFPPLGPWVAPPNRLIPFPNLITLKMPLWPLDPNFWPTFPQRVFNLEFNCFHGSYNIFTHDFLYNEGGIPESVRLIEISCANVSSCITRYPYQGYQHEGKFPVSETDEDYEYNDEENEEDLDDEFQGFQENEEDQEVQDDDNAEMDASDELKDGDNGQKRRGKRAAPSSPMDDLAPCAKAPKLLENQTPSKGLTRN
jgi:hypothetical protein